MPALYVMIPAALLIVAIAIYIFFWAVDSGQYDDLDGPAHSILFDDQDPNHKAAVDEAGGHPAKPDDKLQVLQQLHKEGRKVLMLGDGVNDVPVLAAADISVAMGSATDLAKTSADAVLLSNRLDALVQAFSLARRTRRVIIENLLWAGLYNGLMLPFAALGWITPVWAAVGMSISSLTVVLNALRLTRLPSAPAAGTTPETRPLPA